jgi:hypothetical protein
LKEFRKSDRGGSFKEGQITGCEQMAGDGKEASERED